LKFHGLSITDIKEAPTFTILNTSENIKQCRYEITENNYPIAFYLYEYGNDTTGRYILTAAKETTDLNPDQPGPEIIWFSKDILPLQ
jgi:hemolysin-activating ACP:hemolysin acyltransferase